jgi:hypothetical protein
MATAKGQPSTEKGTPEAAPGEGGVSQDVADTSGEDVPASDDEQIPPDDATAPPPTQMTPIPGVPEGRPKPEEWTPPGDHIKGFYPGDPNVYPDPENPTASY